IEGPAEHIRARVGYGYPVARLVVGMGPGLARCADELQEPTQLIEYRCLRQLQRAAGILDPARRGIPKIVAVVLDISAAVVFNLGDATAVVVGVLEIGAIGPRDPGDVADHVIVNRGYG